MNKYALLLLPLLPASADLLLAAERGSAERPNIILIYSDDHGFADLGAQGADRDVRTPHLDAMARDGVRFVNGYVTAPQCVPSRAGVITGRYQQRFDVNENGKGPLPLAELTIAERLKAAGYVSCQVGKWHLERGPGGEGDEGGAAKAGANAKAARAGRAKARGTSADGLDFHPLGQGFDEYYTGSTGSFIASHDLRGNKLADAPKTLHDARFRCLWQTDAALSFIDRHARDPFFLYLCYFTPHVPLASPEPWFSRTPSHLPLVRRQALAMIAAMDEGIGQIRAKLRAQGNDKNTLIFFIGDNGAPLRPAAWNGSLNTPLVGEKGMLTDGGIRTPFVAAWPGRLPAGKTYDAPVIALDVAATAVALAGLPSDPALDGVNLVPFLRGEKSGEPHEALFWRWRSQAAVLAGKWKLIRLGDTERYLFDLSAPAGEREKTNLIGRFPAIAADLEQRLVAWDATLRTPGLPKTVVAQDQLHFDTHVKATPTAPARTEERVKAKRRPRVAPSKANAN